MCTSAGVYNIRFQMMVVREKKKKLLFIDGVDIMQADEKSAKAAMRLLIYFALHFLSVGYSMA